MKDNPNDKVIADKVLAGDVPDMIKGEAWLGC